MDIVPLALLWALGALAQEPAARAPASRPVRGVHLTSWVAGAPSARRRFLDRLDGTMINAVVIPVKEADGRVYLPGVRSADELGTTRAAIPRPEELMRELKARGLYAIARLVVFADDELPRRKPEWGIQDARGGVWKERGRKTWADPYRREVWDYNLEVAARAAALGFDEIQFDYIRFPSDGDLSRCRYWRADHSSHTAMDALDGFLQEARARLRAQGAAVSVAVFGLTTTDGGGMGIGQRLAALSGRADAISPMMYPSHYAKGEYGIAYPNAHPYRIISLGLRDARRRLGPQAVKLRPYFQDFSLGVRYGVREVREQLRAAREQGVEDWILWNPVNRYTWEALRGEIPGTALAPPPTEQAKTPAPL